MKVNIKCFLSYLSPIHRNRIIPAHLIRPTSSPSTWVNIFPETGMASIANHNNLRKKPDGIKFLIPGGYKCTG